MDLLVLDTNLKAIGVLDTFESLIWTDRYSKYGDFEIYTQVNPEALVALTEDYFLYLRGSEHVMIVEELKINTDAENGNYLTVTGRSMESILDRRIIWGQTTLTGSLQNGIQKLLNENIIAPTIVDRTIDNFIFEASTDPLITSLTIDAQYSGEDLYEAIQKLCETNNIGFKIILTADNKLKFKLYAGADRSYDQIANPYTVFSPKFGNLINSNYTESKKALKTITLIGGEGEGSARKTAIAEIPSGGGSGLSRREKFTDAKDVSSSVDGATLTLPVYTTQLVQKGYESLAESMATKSFDGQVETTSMYTYGEDFFMGDIIQIANEYGHEAKARVVELIHSQSLSGIDVYPTFIKV